MATSGPRMSNFQMLSEEDLKNGAAGPSSTKPSLLTRMRSRPLTTLAVIAGIVIAIVLAIALPVALTGNDDDSGSGSSSGSSGSHSGSSTSSASPSSTSTSSHPAPTMGTGNGCGRVNHTDGYSSSRSNHAITSGDNDRYYAVDVPSNYSSHNDLAWPLILDFHGAGKDVDNQYNNSQYFAEARGDDYIVVYPQGLGNVWEGADYALDHADDMAFISALLEHIDDTYCIDPDRIYASGKSNGGGFVDMLACSDVGDAFSAFAMASAALYSDNSYRDTAVDKCPKSRAILESHGGKDSTVAYTGSKNGNGGDSPDIQDWLDWWARRDGCKKSDDPVVDNDHDGYNITSYSCNGYDNIVQGYYIPELNHCWPSADGNNSDSAARENGCSFRGLDFTSVVLDWFERWNATSAPKN